jgi:CBS domain-containing protein
VLVERLVASGHVLHPDRLRQRIEEERPEDIVALDGRAFILHYRSDVVRALGVALGRAALPVRRDIGLTEDQRQEARIVALIVSPPRQAPRHLQVVKAFANILGDPEALDAVLAAFGAQEIAALPSFAVALPDQLSVRDLMTEQPRTTTPDTALLDAAHQVLRGRLGALPVVDGSHRLVGMLSERELLRDLVSTVPLDGTKVSRPSGSASATPRTVRDVMTRQVLAVGPDQPLAEVAALMSNRDVDRVPVVDEGRLVGLLTRGDLVRKLVGA